MPVDPHILNLHEAFDLKLSDLIAITSAALHGLLVDPVEKVDGQNLTFTVDSSGRIRFIGKGCPTWTREQGGISIEETYRHFADKPVIAATFKDAMGALQEVIDQNPSQFIRACLGGKRNVNAEVTTPLNTNVIRYKGNTICLHGLLPGDPEAFRTLCHGLPKVTNGGWRVMPPPTPEFIQRDDATRRIDFVSMLVEDLMKEYRMLGDLTIGDVGERMLARPLTAECSSFLGLHQVIPAARRLLLEEAKHLGKNDFRSPASWAKFKALDDDRVNFVGRALAPLERITQVMGSFALESYAFKIADPDPKLAEEHLMFVQSVRRAMQGKRVEASPEVLERIQTGLERVNELFFTRNVEGIVFTWQGKRLKLSGAYPGINRVRGYFKYGQNPARIR